MSQNRQSHHFSFQGPCPNCGKSENILSLQERYLKRNESRKSSNFSLEILGLKLGIAVNDHNPDSRYLKKTQGPTATFIDQLLAFLFFMLGLILILFGFAYGILVIVKLYRTHTVMNLWSLTTLIVGYFFLFISNRSNFLSRKRESDYWKAFDLMATVPCCTCGYSPTNVPEEINVIREQA